MQFRGGFRTPSLFSFAVLCRATVGFGDEGSKRVGGFVIRVCDQCSGSVVEGSGCREKFVVAAGNERTKRSFRCLFRDDEMNFIAGSLPLPTTKYADKHCLVGTSGHLRSFRCLAV